LVLYLLAPMELRLLPSGTARHRLKVGEETCRAPSSPAPGDLRPARRGKRRRGSSRPGLSPPPPGAPRRWRARPSAAMLPAFAACTPLTASSTTKHLQRELLGRIRGLSSYVAPLVLHQLSQALAPGLLVGRVNQHAVHVEDSATKTHMLSFLTSARGWGRPSRRGSLPLSPPGFFLWSPAPGSR
jgi:hypothetical protein